MALEASTSSKLDSLLNKLREPNHCNTVDLVVLDSIRRSISQAVDGFLDPDSELSEKLCEATELALTQKVKYWKARISENPSADMHINHAVEEARKYGIDLEVEGISVKPENQTLPAEDQSVIVQYQEESATKRHDDVLEKLRKHTPEKAVSIDYDLWNNTIIPTLGGLEKIKANQEISSLIIPMMLHRAKQLFQGKDGAGGMKKPGYYGHKTTATKIRQLISITQQLSEDTKENGTLLLQEVEAFMSDLPDEE